jgi:uncharacterized protein YraI
MKRKFLPAALALALAASAARAEDAWIKRPADVRADQSAAADPVASVQKGQRVHVLERSGNWVKVDANGRTGWLAADTVSSREVKADVNLLGHGSGAEMSSGAAAKGLQPIAGDYARSHHVTEEGLNQMIAIRKSVTSQMLSDFVKDGGIESGRRPRQTDSSK